MVEKNVRSMPLSSLEQRRQKKRKKRIKRRIIIISILIVFAGIGMLFTPIFNLKEIEITGNLKLKNEEIIKTGNIITEKNIFSVNLKKTGTAISNIPFVNTVEIKRKLPGTLVINITESVPVAYAAYKNMYVVIDKNGKVLERTNDKSGYFVPQVMGINVLKADPSFKISVKDEENFKKTLEILRDLYNNNFIDKISSISMSENGINLKINDNLTIEMGSYEQFNAKVVMVKEIVSSLPKDAVGVIDARNANRVYYDSALPEEIKPKEEKKETVSEAPEE